MSEINEFRHNQSQVPREELEKYNGEYAAWSHDGKRIVAAHSEPEELDEILKGAGYNPGDLLVSFILIPEEVSW